MCLVIIKWLYNVLVIDCERGTMKNTGTLKVATSGDRDIVLTRVFDAPRHLVYRAMTEPEILKRWFGPRGFTMPVCEVDLRVGGVWRFVIQKPDGKQVGMFGKYIELDPPARTVHTESFDDYPGECTVTTTLTEQDGRTTLEATARYPSPEIRNMVLQSGMEHGRRGVLRQTGGTAGGNTSLRGSIVQKQ